MQTINFTPFPNLATNRLLLRKLLPEDDREIFHLRSDETVNYYLERTRAQSLNDARDFIDKINAGIETNTTVYWGIIYKSENRLIGTICIYNINIKSAKAEIGYELLPSFQGKGLMQEALHEVLQYASSSLHLRSIEAFSHKQNESSIALLTKNEFKRDLQAEFGDKELPLDMAIYSKMLN
jgi:[ribosomal protein S5]-alanine N-acetyltransferase